MTDDDVSAHPEFKLARWAGRELDDEARSSATLFTSAEPCPLCASAIHFAGIGRVVYSVAGETLDEEYDARSIALPCREVIRRGDGATTVEGPRLEDAGRAVLDDVL